MKMIEREIENIKAEKGGAISMLIVAVIIFAGLASGGCAGGKVFVGFERTDEISETRKTIDKPLSCLFTDCKGGK